MDIAGNQSGQTMSLVHSIQKRLTIARSATGTRKTMTMAEIINLDDYRNDCGNCVYHEEPGICGKPGGWKWDHRFQRCISFRRKQKEDDGGKGDFTEPPPRVVGADEEKAENIGSAEDQTKKCGASGAGDRVSDCSSERHCGGIPLL